MPIYEYACEACRRRSSVFVRTVTSNVHPVCSHCGSTQLQRLVSTFAFHRSLPSRWEEAGHPYDAKPGYEDDPANIGRWAETRAAELGIELPSEIKDMIAAARQGETPVPPDYGGADMPDPLRDL